MLIDYSRMKKTILMIFISIIVALILILYLFRHHIIGHAFKVSISSKTNKTVELNIGHVHYSIINSSVSFTNSNLKFHNVYINKHKTIELSEFKFDEIELSGLSVFHLLFKDEVFADKFIVGKPSFWFQENNNPQPFKEPPKEIIKSLKQHPDLLGDLKVVVNEIEITHGKVDLKSILDDDLHSGSVDFKIILRNFDTSKEELWSEDRVLFAKEHLVSLSGFNYQFPNGDRIGFDSLNFLSEKNELDIKNLHFDMIENNTQSKIAGVSSTMKNLHITGISLMDFQDLGKIDVDTILFSDAYIKVKRRISDTIDYNNDTVSTDKHYSKKLKEFLVGTLMLDNINIVYNNELGDTIAFVSDLDFKVSDLLFDSTFFDRRIPKLNFSSIRSEINRVVINNEKTGANISFNDFTFNELEKTVAFHEISVIERKKDSNSIKINTGSVELSNISLEGFLKKQYLPIEVSIKNPTAVIDMYAHENKRNENHKLPEGLMFSNIRVDNGSLTLNMKDNIKLNIAGIDLNSGDFSLDSITHIKNLDLSKTDFLYSNMKLILVKKRISISTDSMVFTNSSLLLDNILLKTKDDVNNNSTIEVEEVYFTGCDFNSILEKGILTLGNVSIKRPRIRGNFFHEVNNSVSKHKKETGFGYGLVLEKLSLIDGDLDFNINTGGDTISVITNVNLSTQDVDVKHFKDNTWLQNITWKLKLENTLFQNNEISVSLQELYSDRSHEVLSLKNLIVKDNDNPSRKFTINNFMIDNLDFRGINYYSFFNNDTPVIRYAKVTNPTIDLKLDTRSAGQKSSEHKKSKLTLPFELDELTMVGLSLNLEQQNNESVSFIGIGNVDFSYSIDGSENLFNDLGYLNVENVSFSDTIKNMFSAIDMVMVNPKEKDIIIKNIVGGNINAKISTENHLGYTSTKCMLSDLYVSHTFPVEISVGKLEFDDFSVNVEKTGKNNKHKPKTERKSLRIPDDIAFVNVNKFIVNDLGFSQVSMSDSATKKIHLTDLTLLVDSVRIDSTNIHRSDFSFVKSAAVEFGKENRFISKDSLYVTTISGISYNFDKHKLIVDSLAVAPRYEDTEFFQRAKYQTGRMNIVTDQISCSDFRFDEFIKRGKIHFGAIDITGLDTRIYRNKTYEIKPGTYKKLPQEALLGIEKPITIDSLKTHDAYIKYKELDKKSIVPGEIFLDSFNLSIYNINNDLKVIDNSSTMVARLNAMLLGQSKLDLKVTFPLLSPSNDFWVEGSVESIDFSGLNSMTQNLVGVTMKRGSGGLEIPLISGNGDHSDGSLLFSYNKLKIELYDREKAKNARGLTGSMASLLLNDIFIKSNNPGFLGKTRPGEVYFKRDTQKSIVSYIWKSIMSGLMSTMGYNNKEQRHEKKALRRKNRE